LCVAAVSDGKAQGRSSWQRQFGKITDADQAEWPAPASGNEEAVHAVARQQRWFCVREISADVGAGIWSSMIDEVQPSTRPIRVHCLFACLYVGSISHDG